MLHAVRLAMGAVLWASFSGLALADDSQYAPLESSDAFYKAATGYMVLSKCINGYLADPGTQNSASARVARAVVSQGKEKELLSRTKALLPAGDTVIRILDAEISSPDSEQTKVQIALLALATLSQREDWNRTRQLAALSIARYYMSFATEGECSPSPELVEFIQKVDSWS